MSELRVSRAVVLERFGAPLSVWEFPVGAPPAGGMTVACRYGGICGTDLHLRLGHLPVPTPLVLGHEGLGAVDELCEGVEVDANGERLQPGDDVMWASSISCGQCVPCRLHREPTLCERRQTYGVNRSVREEPPLSGSWAEYISLRPGTTVVKLPADIDHLAAMSLAIGQYTDSGDVEVNPHQSRVRRMVDEPRRNRWALERSRIAYRATKHKKAVLRSGGDATAVVRFLADGGRANEFRQLVYLELEVSRPGSRPSLPRPHPARLGNLTNGGLGCGHGERRPTAAMASAWSASG